MIRRREARRGGLGALAVVLVVLPFVLPNTYYLNVAILAGLNAITCIGLNLLIGYAGQISLGHAAFFGIGAYVSAILTAGQGWPPALALVAGMLANGALAFAVARPILRLRGHYLAMATLGLGIIAAIVLAQEVRLTGGPDGMPVPPLALLGWSPQGEAAWYGIVAVLLWIAAWLSLNLARSPIGRALAALNASEIAAATAGIDVARHKSLVFVVSALYASLAGSLFAHYAGFITPAKAGFLQSVELVTMVVLGGMASTFGAVVGAAILTALPQVFATFHEYESIALGAILVGIMIFLPRGLVPSLARLAGRR
ncbi:MAG: branched-chain amino acid ABC transporter permease [Alphaproteobacteria bacterium]|nr:branched-chain amino acid ABC transporter permease [Alphaproteobacteria bacterium]